MELRHLKYFLAVAETENIRAASSIVHVTQPAISRQLQELEQELGVELFERLPRGLKLNQAGKHYQKHIQEIFRQLDEANRQLQQFMVAANGHLSLGAVDVVLWEGKVPAIIRQFRQSHSNVTLEMRTDNSPELLALLNRELIDGAFVYLFDALPEGFDHYAIAKDRLKLVYPTEWQNDDHELSFQSLQTFPMIRFPRGVYPSYYDWQQNLLTRLGFNPTVTQWAHNESAMLGMVATGNGFAIVNECQGSLRSKLIHFIDLPINNAVLPLMLVYKKSNDNPALRALITLLENSI